MKQQEQVAKYWAESAAESAPRGASPIAVAEVIARIARMVFRIAFMRSLDIGHGAVRQEEKRRGGEL